MAQVRTVGTGGDYANFAAAITALPDNFTQDITLQQISDVTDDGATDITMNLGGLAIDLNGLTLKITQDISHNGDPTRGWIHTLTGGRSWFPTHGLSDSGTIIFDGLFIDQTAVSPVIRFQVALGTYGFQVNNCLIRGGSYGIQYDNPAATNDTFIIKNCKVWGSGSHSLDLDTSPVDVNVVTVENSIFYRAAGNPVGLGSYPCTMRNCAANGFTNNVSQINANGYNNASTDAFIEDADWNDGSGNLVSQTWTDLVESVDDTSSDFLKPKITTVGSVAGSASAAPQKGAAPLTVNFSAGLSYTAPVGGALIGAGTTPVYATTSIEGNPRPDDSGNINIGPHEQDYSL